MKRTGVVNLRSLRRLFEGGLTVRVVNRIQERVVRDVIGTFCRWSQEHGVVISGNLPASLVP